MKRIVTVPGAAAAFTAKNCPGYTEEHPADSKALETQAKAMNQRAEKLEITTRYTVEP